MAEKCPLEITAGNLEADKDGFFWDTGIPDKCWDCINKALSRSDGQIEHFQPEIYEDEDPEMWDLWQCIGIRRANESPARIAVAEVGIDDDGNNETGLLNRTSVSFICPRP